MVLCRSPSAFTLVFPLALQSAETPTSSDGAPRSPLPYHTRYLTAARARTVSSCRRRLCPKTFRPSDVASILAMLRQTRRSNIQKSAPTCCTPFPTVVTFLDASPTFEPCTSQWTAVVIGVVSVTMSGVGFLVKTFTPSGRRRRRCEKLQHKLELPGYGQCHPDVVPCWDTAPPITPPAAFLPPGYKRKSVGETPINRIAYNTILHPHIGWFYVALFCYNAATFPNSCCESWLLFNIGHLPFLLLKCSSTF